MRQIDSDARFGKGDSIRVLLSVTQVYDKGKRAYVNQSYCIDEFREIFITPEQPTLLGMQASLGSRKPLPIKEIPPIKATMVRVL